MTSAASIALIEHDGKILCAWNRRYNGWGLPGGKVENGETNYDALVREVKEETGLQLSAASCIYSDLSCTEDADRRIFVFRAWLYAFPSTTPYTIEKGSPIDWLTREELLEKSPFKMYYEKMFTRIK